MAFHLHPIKCTHPTTVYWGQCPPGYLFASPLLSIPKFIPTPCFYPFRLDSHVTPSFSTLKNQPKSPPLRGSPWYHSIYMASHPSPYLSHYLLRFFRTQRRYLILLSRQMLRWKLFCKHAYSLCVCMQIPRVKTTGLSTPHATPPPPRSILLHAWGSQPTWTTSQTSLHPASWLGLVMGSMGWRLECSCSGWRKPLLLLGSPPHKIPP